MSQDSAGNIIHRLHALDLTNGNELFGGPTAITATYPGTGGNSSGGIVTFLPSVHHDRAALLESGGMIYMAWSGLWGDCGSYSAWVMAYDGGTPGTSNNYDNSFVRLSTSAGLTVGDYFAPFNTVTVEDPQDLDFGSAGPLLLPNLVDASNVTHHLAV